MTMDRRFRARALPALALAFTMSLVADAAQVRPSADACASGDPQARVGACTLLLNRTGLDPASKLTAYVNRGRAHDALDQVDAALKDYASALAVDPTNAMALRSRAMTLHSRGRSTEAVRDLTSALSSHADDLITLRVRGTVYAESGQIARAVEDFSKVLDQMPSDLVAREGRGLALAAGGDHGRAVQDFTRVLQREPRAHVARAARAYSLFSTGQYQRAVTDWDLLLNDNPSQLAVVYCRGAAKVLSGDNTGRADMDGVRQQKPDVAAVQARICSVPAE